MTDDDLQVGDEVSITIQGEISRFRGVGGHLKAVVESEGIQGGAVVVYLHDTIDGEYAENYTDHRAANLQKIEEADQ